MPTYVVKRGRDGVRRSEMVDPEKYKMSGDGPAEPKRAAPTVASEAFRELRVQLHKWSLEKVLPYIGMLEAVEEVERLHAMEKLHPLYGGGRNSVLDRLEERMGELRLKDAHINTALLDAPDPTADPAEPLVPRVEADEPVGTTAAPPAGATILPEHAPKQKYPCDVCGFPAATPLGLSSHRRAKHPNAEPVNEAARSAEGAPAEVVATEPEPAVPMDEDTPLPTLGSMIDALPHEDGE